MTEKETKERLEGLHNSYSKGVENGREYPGIQKDIEALEMALDILDDYEKQGRQLGKMMEHYETAKRPRKDHLLGIYLCPFCRGRVNFHQGYCQKCGKRLNPERTRYDIRETH